MIDNEQRMEERKRERLAMMTTETDGVCFALNTSNNPDDDEGQRLLLLNPPIMEGASRTIVLPYQMCRH